MAKLKDATVQKLFHGMGIKTIRMSLSWEAWMIGKKRMC